MAEERLPWTSDPTDIRYRVFAIKFNTRLRVTLKDGTVREGDLVYRSGRRGFTVNDGIRTIPYEAVQEIEVIEDA